MTTTTITTPTLSPVRLMLGCPVTMKPADAASLCGLDQDDMDSAESVLVYRRSLYALHLKDGRFWTIGGRDDIVDAELGPIEQFLSDYAVGEFEPLPVPNLTATIERMKTEVLADIANGKLPDDVGSFSDLHGFVDANEYGGLTEDDIFDSLVAHFGGRDSDDGMPQGMLDFINAAQEAVSVWLSRRQSDDSVIGKATHAALDEACRVVQDHLGVKTGDFAGTYWTGGNFDAVRRAIAAYLDAERQQQTGF